MLVLLIILIYQTWTCPSLPFVQELLMDTSFHLSGVSSCAAKGSSGSGINHGMGSAGGGPSMAGSSTGGSITNSIGGGSSNVVVVIADPPPDIDSDSDNEFFFDALSDSHCVECKMEYLGSQFDHFDFDSESSNKFKLEDNGLDQFVEQNNVNKIYSPLSTMRSSQSITKKSAKAVQRI